MTKQFWLIMAVVVVGLGGIFWFTRNKASAPSGNTTQTLTNHIYNQGKSGVTLTEYGDFECPACYQFEPVVEQIRDKYKDQVTFQFRHYPLVQLHKNALAGARAAEAADKQGKFWEMHDSLYQNQDPTGKSGWVASSNPLTLFDQFATQLGLDINKFNTDFKSDQVNNSVQADLADAQKKGYGGTPTFELNGKQVTDPRPEVDFFVKLLDDAIAAKKS